VGRDAGREMLPLVTFIQQRNVGSAVPETLAIAHRESNRSGSYSA
jgi:hypothetical protein